MRDVVLMVALVVMFAGCNPCQRLARKCPPNVIVKDSTVYRDSVVYRTRIIRDTIPGDTVRVDSLIPVEVPLNVPPISADNKYAEAEAGVRNSHLWLELRQKEQVITHLLDSAEREITHWRERYYEKEATTIIKERFVPKFHKIASIYAICITILLVAYIYVKMSGKSLISSLFNFLRNLFKKPS